MSTAVMASSAKYDFGDMLYKGHTTRNSNTVDHPQKMLRWGEDSSERAVGSPVGSTTLQHQTLVRRNSNPAGSAASITMISLASSVSTLILDNIRDQAQPHRKLDRSQSEPAPSALINAAKAANINTSRYKTELCRPFEESGSCKYGDKCQFAHGIHELRNLVRHPKYKTELCRTFHTIGFCPYGPRCHFIHNAEEARTKMPTMARTMSPPGTALAIIKRPKPLTLTGSNTFMITGSTADSPSPNSSLSQSPTTSVGSFFSSEPDIFHTVVPSTPPPSASANTAFSFCQDFNSLVQVGGSKHRGPSPSESSLASISPVGSLSPRESPPPNSPEARLPVFNRLSSTVMTFGGLAELLA